MRHNYSSQYKNALIKPLEIEDIEYLRKWRNDRSNTVFLRSVPYITSDAQLSWFKRYLLNEDELYFSINEIYELNRIVGSMALYNFRGNQAEFGKILIGDPSAHGKNLGYNSIKALLEIAFKQIKLFKIILHVYKENVGAVHIYKEIGFSVIDTHVNEGKIEYTMEMSN